MTDEELKKALHWCGEDTCSGCPLEKYYPARCRLYLTSEAYGRISLLEAENAALRERLKKAVELPFEVGSAVYVIHETDEEDKFNPWIDVGKVVSFSFDGKLWIFVRYNSGLTMWYTKDTFDKEVCLTPEAAEARLAELKRGKER